MLPEPLKPLARRVRGVLRRLRGEAQRAGRSLAFDAASQRVAAALDRRFYLAMNPDVAAARADPVSHFLSFGWREGRDPTPHFSVRDYLELYPEVRDSGENPFAHYLRVGRAEGRIAKRDLGFRHDIVAGLKPLEARLAEAARHWEKRRPTPPARLAQALATSRGAHADLHLTVSHDDYSANVGGLQICVQREARALAGQGVDHLHLFPADIWPMVRPGPDTSLLGVLWNGQVVGHFEPAAVAEALAATPAGRRTFALHSLLGHSAQDILSVLQAAGMKAGWFWLHDFASLCAGFHLMRNDVADCAAPPADSPACGICLYGPRRQLHVDAHRLLFDALDLTVVAPSQATLDLWLRAGNYRRAGELVRPHAAMVDPRPSTPATSERPFRLAFVGVGAPHKGWPVFHELAVRFADDPRYAFVHLGRRGVQGLPIEHHDVTVTPDHPQAMRDALERFEIDAALVWPLCRETFSFTAYEAAAAGAAVLTNPDSGNVATFVAEGGHGRVLADEAALIALFESGEALELARAKRRPTLYNLDFGALTAELRAGPEAGPASGSR